MPDDFDDFEHVAPPRPRARRAPPSGVLLAAAIVIVAIGGLSAVFLLSPRHAAEPPPRPSPTAAPRPTEPSHEPLPSLDESDAFIRQIAAGLSTHPELARWLARTALVRTFTVVVASIARGETPRPDLDFLAPAQRFRAAGAGRRTVPDPASYAGYDGFGDAIASIDAAAAANAYRAGAPLFDTAARDLGYAEGFRPLLDGAMHELLEVPAAPPDVTLEPQPVGFRWADPALEALSAAQKQLLRTGPRNVKLVQAKLRELQSSLAP
jgi:hypothetical protein